MKKQDSEVLNQRQEKLAERLDPTWQPQTDTPIFSVGNINYEISARTQAINYGGLGLAVLLVKSVGLADELDKSLHLLKRHHPYHESDHILNMVYNIVTGGQCLEDLELRRQDVGYLDALNAQRIPDPTTEGDFLRRFHQQDVITFMDTINRVRSRIWREQQSNKRRLAIIDVDGTITETMGETKEKADFAYNGKWGYCPLVVSLANTQEPLYIINRPASRPSHDGAVKIMDRAVNWARDANFFRVRLRGDTDFSLTTEFDRWNREGVEFVFGIDAHPSFTRIAEGLDEESYKPLERSAKWTVRTTPRTRPLNVKKAVVREKGYENRRLQAEHVAEVEYTPSKATGKYRMIILRKNISVERGERHLFDDIVYFFYVTNIACSELMTEDVVRQANLRCNQENLIEQLKNGVKATRLPVAEFVGNWAYMVIGSLAWSLKIWLGLVLPQRLNASQLIKMEFRRFCKEVMQIPAQILNHGRRLIFRLLGYNRWVELLIEGSRHLKALAFA